MTSLPPLDALAVDFARRVTDGGADYDVTRTALAAAVADRYSTKGDRVADALRIFDTKTGRLSAEAAPSRKGSKTRAAGPMPSLADLGFVVLSDVKAEPVDWLWEGWIPRAMLAVLDGRPGAGKTTLLCDLAARVTRARAMPTEDTVPPEREPAAVIFVTSENAFAQVLRPRLEAAEANLERCIGWSTTPEEDGAPDCPRFPRDTDKLAAAVRHYRAALVIVDPLFSHMDDELSPNRETDVRRALVPPARIAEETGAAVIAVRHFNKAANGDALNAGGGSIGIVGTARVQIVVGQPPESSPDDPERVVAVGKMNIARMPSARSFSIVEADEAGVPTSRIKWGGVSSSTASDLTRAHVPNGGAQPVQGEVADWLREALADGPRLARDLWSEAEEHGFAKATVKRTKKALGVKAERAGYGADGAWIWVLSGCEPKGITALYPDPVIPFENQPPLWDKEAGGDSATPLGDSIGDHAPGIRANALPFEGDGGPDGPPLPSPTFAPGARVSLDGRPGTVDTVDADGTVYVATNAETVTFVEAGEYDRLAPLDDA